MDIDPNVAAAIVALRPSIENLIVRVSDNPESFFPLMNLDQKLVQIIGELCQMNTDDQGREEEGNGGGGASFHDWNRNPQGQARFEDGTEYGEDDDYGDDEISGDFTNEARGVKRTHDDTEFSGNDGEQGSASSKVPRTSYDGSMEPRGRGRGFRGHRGNRGGFYNNSGGYGSGNYRGGYGASRGGGSRGGYGYESRGGYGGGGGFRGNGGRFQAGNNRGGWNPRGSGSRPFRRPNRGGYGSNYPF